jgi:hypothetical protein
MKLIYLPGIKLSILPFCKREEWKLLYQEEEQNRVKPKKPQNKVTMRKLTKIKQS